MELFANDIRIPFGGSMTLRFYNPLFNDIGSHSLPITVSASHPSTLKAFGFPGKEGVNAPQTVPARIKTSLLDLQGAWQISQSSDKMIEAYYKGNMGNFYSLVADTLLTGLTYGGLKYPVGEYGNAADMRAHMLTKMDAVYPAHEYAVYCAYMPEAYGTDTAEGLKFVNEVDWDQFDGYFIKDKEAEQHDTVYLFAGTVLDYLFSQYGYRIGKNIFEYNTELSRLTIFNAFNRQSSPTLDYTKLVPAVKCTDFLKALTNRFNIGFFIDERSKVVNIISFDDMLNKGLNSLQCKFTSKPVIDNRRLTGLNFKLNAPDEWSAHTYTGEEQFYPFEPIVVDKFRDIVPGALNLNYVYFVKSDGSYYKIVYKDSVYSAERKCSKFFPYTSGTEVTEVEQFSGIPAMYTHSIDTTWTEQVWDPVGEQFIPTERNITLDMVMPRYDLNVKDNANPTNSFPLMFIFARGVQTCYMVPGDNPPLREYPLGSNDIYDAEGNVVTGATLSLAWGGSTGLIETFWANRNYWELNTKKIVKASMTADDVNKLIDFTGVDRIELNNYIVNSVDVEVSQSQVRVKEVELFRL